MFRYLKPEVVSYVADNFESIVSCQYTGSLQITFRQASVVMNVQKPSYTYVSCNSKENSNEGIVKVNI
jgi:hypothetical protein